MGEFGKWLLHEDQKELYDYLFAVVLNAVFLAVVALLLWPAGRASVAWRLTKGFWLFWILIILMAVLFVTFRRIFRVSMDEHFDAYVISGLVSSGIVQAGWSAFASLVARDAAAGATVWLAAALYLVGLLSCWVALTIVSAFYTGSIYRYINLWVALASFVLFSVWPAAGRALYGWFFDLF